MAGRVLELRVHGVSNTPPEALLGLEPEPGQGQPPPAHRVAGDATTGFYRRPADQPDDRPALEAYSWGQLTSGARSAGVRAVKDLERALWTLLLPFSLANVALHARPDIPADPAQERWLSRSGFTAWLIRVFCLSLTATFALAAAGVGVDLVAWQCVDANCLGRIPGPWEFLAGPGWSGTSRPLAVGLALPVVVLFVLWGTARRSFRYERALPDGAAESAGQELQNPLQQPGFWRGEDQVRRLGMLHLAVGLAVATAVPLVALLAAGRYLDLREPIALVILGLLALVVGLALACLAHPAVARRRPAGPTGPTAGDGAGRLVRWLGALAQRPGWIFLLAALAVAATALLLLVEPASRLLGTYPPMTCAELPDQPGCAEDRSLPGYDQAVAWLAAGQLAVLVLVAGISRTGRRAMVVVAVVAALLAVGYVAVGDQIDGWRLAAALAAALVVAVGLVLVFPRSGGAAEEIADRYARVAWGGRAPAVLAGVGWALGMVYSAGVLFGATNILNADATATGDSSIDPPVPLVWGAIGLVAAILILVVAGVVLFCVWRRRRKESLPGILADEYLTGGAALSCQEQQRAGDVARWYGLHRLVERAGVRTVGWLVLIGAAVVAAGVAGGLTGWPELPIKFPEEPDGPGEKYGPAISKWIIDVGGSLAGLLPIAIAGIGFLIYRNQTFRRAFGVVWDIATFWPRAAHPFAPPSYAELVVPQLQTRAAGLLHLPEEHEDKVDCLILAGHSQGALVCAAGILQLPDPIRSRIWLVSYGCQLGRLYGRVFPAYFGPDRLQVVSTVLGAKPGVDPRWTNLWRDTDPLGYPVRGDHHLVPLREVRLHDPVADGYPLRVPGNNVIPPPIRNHSDYPKDPAYRAEVSSAADQLCPPRPDLT